MAKFFSELDDALTAFIAAQKVFFTATAPRDDAGRINLSPKGLENTFRCLDAHTVAYLDLTGSGNETAAHLLEPGNGRMTIMFCSFGEKPLILRLYGRGRPVRPGDPDWDQLAARFPELPGQRQIIVLDVQSVQTSCGFGVPVYENAGEERPLLVRWAEKKGPDGIEHYQREKNATSIDGLPSHLTPA